MEFQVGLDIGSTTAKLVAINKQNEIVFKSYQRHFSDIKNTTLRLLQVFSEKIPSSKLKINVSGSSGISLCEVLGIPFIQEVVACTEAVKKTANHIDVIIELGGEDAKIIYLTGGIEQRMNAACAGGTGAFIDQIASLLNTDAPGLNELAKGAEKIYPIASRCGVFAKTDIQPLINEGARKEDIAASIFQAVVNQTIAGLANGRPIRGNVAFLGGPLTFLTELRKRFMKTLKLTDEHILHNEDGHYYVAIGAALESEANEYIEVERLIELLTDLNQSVHAEQSKRLNTLFSTKEEYQKFITRHNKAKVVQRPLESYTGKAFLGIDAGSTTTKMILTSENDEVLYSFYKNNKGNPLESVREGLAYLYESLPESVEIANSTVTGYGEKLIKAAFELDGGEIEIVAHYTAAKKFQPDVDLIIDIGGQDMKCIKIRNGVIDEIILNEACSAGCGSFLESFAETLGRNVQEFSNIALESKNPVDLGSRCTVFMNSKVKQVQKEGASISDISAGLSYSVVMNALYKVIKITTPEELGNKVVVQGGTFLNEAVLRAFETVTGKEVIRPDLSGLMGAFGSALLSKQRYENKNSSILSKEKLLEFQVTTTHRRCGICENRCPITINRFSDKRTFITGNRCERGEGKQKQKSLFPNMMEEKLEKLFNRTGLSEDQAYRGKIGIPRALNMFENYPFWHQFFTELGFEVVLSDPSNKKTFEKGMGTIPSESVCYPAKLVHGHIQNLIEKGIKTIFYPSVIYEKNEHETLQNHFNCPVVASYPEVIRVNMAEILKENNISYISPFLTLDDSRSLIKSLTDCFAVISKKEISVAYQKAKSEETAYINWLRKRGEEIVAEIKENNIKGIVVSGHPYHIDPAINHGVPEEINRLGMVVLTEDSVSHLTNEYSSFNVVNQWTFHSRLYRATDVVKENKELELLHLTSFGCGLDAVTSDAVKDNLSKVGRLYTWIKIDEITNLGAVRIRLRSLKAAVQEREKKTNKMVATPKIELNPPIFTKEAKEAYTILSPQMLPSHFAIMEKAFKQHGYRLKILNNVSDHDVKEGLRYVNNDACYPAIITIGQLVAALKSGEYDVNRTAVIMSQTGGGCRQTNYLTLLKMVMSKAGFPQVPVLSLNAGGLPGNTQPGFKISINLFKKLIVAACLGDLLMRLKHAVRPYEVTNRNTENVFNKWESSCAEFITNFTMSDYKKIIQEMVRDFENIPVTGERKPRVGIVGEILVKFHPFANNELVDIIESEGGEAVVPDFVDFFLYCLDVRQFNSKHFGKPKIQATIGFIISQFIDYYRKPIREALRKSDRFETPTEFHELAEKASEFLSLGNQMGEGWLLTGEMAEFMEAGVENVVCVQPFGCLPNHIIGKGMFNAIKAHYPNANLIGIDYDSNVSKVNQVNRIKLMMNIANDKMKEHIQVEIK
ncbi:MAG: hypothetical protein K0R71_1751 [Bacillales bacterium]|jgi:predicted CoA-substrate-specific enzyme activase|nr:hypothetical protein [Bacillales bacterium]